MDGITDSVDMSLTQWTLGDGEGQGRMGCCSPWSHRVRHDLTSQQEQERDEIDRIVTVTPMTFALA